MVQQAVAAASASAGGGGTAGFTVIDDEEAEAWARRIAAEDDLAQMRWFTVCNVLAFSSTLAFGMTLVAYLTSPDFGPSTVGVVVTGLITLVVVSITIKIRFDKWINERSTSISSIPKAKLAAFLSQNQLQHDEYPKRKSSTKVTTTVDEKPPRKLSHRPEPVDTCVIDFRFENSLLWTPPPSIIPQTVVCISRRPSIAVPIYECAEEEDEAISDDGPSTITVWL